MNLPWSELDLLLMQPGWLWLLPVVVSFLFLHWFKPALFTAVDVAQNLHSADGEVKVRHPLINLLETAGGETVKRSSKGLLPTLIISSLLFSLSEPVLQGEQLPDPPQERDIFLLVDASISMVLRDYLLEGRRVDRMSLLKGVLDRMVQRLEGDRIGIIVFGEHAYTLTPLTRDQKLLRRMLVRIEPTVAGRYSAVGEAIALALKQIEQPHGGDEQRRRVLVLFSAASHPTGTINDRAAATLSAELKVPIYTVAIGAASHGAAERRKGELIYEPADLTRMEQLASMTGGVSFRAGDSAAFDRAMKDIELREINKRELPPRHITYPLYHWPLLFGLMLLTISQIMRLLQRGS